MVSTRHHPKEFPEPATPSQRSSPSTSTSPIATALSPISKITGVAKSSPTKSPARRKAAGSAASVSGYVHTPSAFIIAWLLLSLVLVFWDTAYVFLRPHSMPGGALHSPLWTPYGLYGTVDYMYGWPAWNNRVGFTAAQASLNAFESIAYVYYLVICWMYGGGAAGLQSLLQSRSRGKIKVQGGPPNAVSAAVVVCFSAAVMTVSKTVLYWLNEAFGGFDNIGHNNPLRLFILWIIPNGAWLVFPSYIIYILGKELVEALDEHDGKPKAS